MRNDETLQVQECTPQEMISISTKFQRLSQANQYMVFTSIQSGGKGFTAAGLYLLQLVRDTEENPSPDSEDGQKAFNLALHYQEHLRVIGDKVELMGDSQD